MMRFNLLKKFFIPVAIIAIAATVTLAAHAADRGIVILNASWCYSCREVIPIAQEVASQNSLSVTVIDIDSQDAPRLARSYGISIPNERTEQAPWIYFVDRGRTVQIFNGSNYKPGYEDNARSTILGNLQRTIGHPMGQPTPMAPSGN